MMKLSAGMEKYLIFFVVILFLAAPLAACTRPANQAREISLQSPSPEPQKAFTIECRRKGQGVVTVSFAIPDGLKFKKLLVYRSTSNLGSLSLSSTDLISYPITRFILRPGDLRNLLFDDEYAANNASYFYVADLYPENGGMIRSNCVTIVTPSVPFGTLVNPSLYIDKVHYFLEVRDNERPRKRYPIALGRNPFKRKLNQDRASTPEGLYHITNVQKVATYYKAYDIDYPNEMDRIRYDFSCKNRLIPLREGAIPDIGGEIEIHGMGITCNWTWGCIALRNSDMDELFSEKKIASGTPVIIVGNEITAGDVDFLRRSKSPDEIRSIQKSLVAKGYKYVAVNGILDTATYNALGQFQKACKLPVTCIPDTRTMKALRDTRATHI